MSKRMWSRKSTEQLLMEQEFKAKLMVETIKRKIEEQEQELKRQRQLLLKKVETSMYDPEQSNVGIETCVMNVKRAKTTIQTLSTNLKSLNTVLEVISTATTNHQMNQLVASSNDLIEKVLGVAKVDKVYDLEVNLQKIKKMSDETTKVMDGATTVHVTPEEINDEIAKARTMVMHDMNLAEPSESVETTEVLQDIFKLVSNGRSPEAPSSQKNHAAGTS